MRVVADVPSATLVKKEKTPNNLNNFKLYKSDNNAENVPENSQVSSTISEYDDNYNNMYKKDQVVEMMKNDNDNENENELKKFPSPFVSKGSRRKGRTSILFPILKESISPLLSPEQQSLTSTCRNSTSTSTSTSTSRRMTLSPATARSLILEVMEEKEHKEKENKENQQSEALLNRDMKSALGIGISSPQPHLPLLLSSPLPFSLSTLTTNSPLLMPLYPPLNSPPANYPLVVINHNQNSNQKNENDKIMFNDVIDTSLLKEIEKTETKNGRISNKTAMMNFKILADQKIKTTNEEKEKNVLLFENDKKDNGEEEEHEVVTDMIDMTDWSTQTIIVNSMTETEMISTYIICNSNDQSLPKERSMADEECSNGKPQEETISTKMELSNEVNRQNSDENKNQYKNKKEMSEDIVCEKMNDKETIMVTEIEVMKVMKNLAYHDELNALLDSDSDISTSISPVRPAYPVTAIAISNDPVDFSSGIFHVDLDLTNGSDSSPVRVKDPSTDTGMTCTVFPHQSTTSPGRFLEMTYLSELTEDSFHTFLSLSEGLISQNENVNDVIIDELDGNTVLLNNSLIAVDHTSTSIINQMNNNNEYNHEEKSIITSSTPTTILEQIDDYSNVKMDIQKEEEKFIGSSDTTVLVRKRVEEYSERNEMVKKSKMEILKTSLSCRTIDSLTIIDNANAKNVPGNDSMDITLLNIAGKENENDSNIVNMNTQQADTIAVVDVDVDATTHVHDVGIEIQNTSTKQQLMNTTSNSNNNNNNDNEILTEVTLENARDRAIGRMNIRNEIVKWKYGWEIASFCAAQVARQKLALLPPF